MIALTQVVDQASVSIYDQENTERGIGNGLLVLLGVSQNDTEKDVLLLVNKLEKLRIFPDGDRKMNLDIKSAKGEVLLISQFTLYGNVKGGNRPDFINAAGKELATNLYELFADKLTQAGISVKKGFFGEHMKVTSVQNGPVTIILDSEKL